MKNQPKKTKQPKQKKYWLRTVAIKDKDGLIRRVVGEVKPEDKAAWHKEVLSYNADWDNWEHWISNVDFRERLSRNQKR